MGAAEQAIAKNAMRTGREIPARIKNAPRIPLEQIYYMQAYLELETDRPISHGYCYIPNSAIRSYARSCGANDEEGHELVYIVRMIDDAIVPHVNKKQQKRAEQDGRRGKDRGKRR